MTTDELADDLEALAGKLRQYPGLHILTEHPLIRSCDIANYGERHEDYNNRDFHGRQVRVRWWHRWVKADTGWVTETSEPPVDLDGPVLPAEQVLAIWTEPEGEQG